MKSRGVLYCATTHATYLEAAVVSAIALRQHEPNIPITLISDHPRLKRLPLHQYGILPKFLETDAVDRGSFLSRFVKTQLNRFSPYQETLFLDADILPLLPISDLWDYLDQGDFAMVVDRLPAISLCDHIGHEEKEYTLQRLPGDTVHFNSGVMLWRNTISTQTLFQQWHQEWQTFQKQDQLALARAINTVQIPIIELPKNYNISPIDAASLTVEDQQVHLLHCWGGMVESGQFRQIAHKFYPQVMEVLAGLGVSLAVAG